MAPPDPGQWISLRPAWQPDGTGGTGNSIGDRAGAQMAQLALGDYPDRYRLANELHARPFPVLEPPTRAVLLAIKEPEAAAESSGGVSFAYPVRDAEITIQVAGWSSTLTFQPDSLRRATGAGADEDRIVVRVELADGIRRFSFSIDDMQPEDEG